MTASDPALDASAVDALLDLAGGDLDFVDEIAETYLEDAPRQLEALSAAVEAGDVAAIIAPAHTLKSSSASVGAVPLAEHARELEALARSGGVPDAGSRLETLQAEYERVAAALRARPWRRTT